MQYLIDTDLLDQHLFTAVIAASSPLVGASVRDSGFREKFNAAVIGVHREGVRAPLPAVDSILQAGDVLLLGSPAAWGDDNAHNANFSMVNQVSRLVLLPELCVFILPPPVVASGNHSLPSSISHYFLPHPLPRCPGPTLQRKTAVCLPSSWVSPWSLFRYVLLL